MITKPSIFDMKYQNMNQEDTLLNYERDMMLWEQTEALNRISNGNSSSRTIEPYTSDYTPNISKFKINAPERDKYARLSNNYNSLMDKEFYLSNNALSGLVFITVIILVALPVCICTNLELAKMLGFVALPISLIPIILLKLKITNVRSEIKEIVSQLDELDKKADIKNTPKKSSKKVSKK